MKEVLIILIVLGVILNVIYLHLISEFMKTRSKLLVNKKDLKEYILSESNLLDDQTIEMVLRLQDEYIKNK